MAFDKVSVKTLLNKRYSLLWLCFWICLSAQAQQLKGRVVDAETNEAMPFVSVFVNTTTIGTSTSEKGEFTLSLSPGKYEIVVSYIGYEPIIYQVDMNQPPPSILFKLSPKEFALSQVEVTSQRDSSWYVNLEVFKENFLGRSRIARKCKLLNPEVLIIDFNPQTGLLDVKARDVLQIENPELGYLIKYLLIEFQFDTQENYVSFSGFPSYELMKGNKAKEKRWLRNRQTAYNGSVMHFVRALRVQQLQEERFNLRRLIRTPNPNRPSEEELEAARAQLRQRGNYTTLAKDDPISITLSKASLPKIIEKLDTAKVPYKQYMHTTETGTFMAFEGFFQVVYTGEKEELSYVQATSMFQSRRPTYQTSVISLRSASVFLEEMGNIIEPLDVLFEGYWGWEKLGDMLPLDYQSGKESK
jgi:hypothetical protein